MGTTASSSARGSLSADREAFLVDADGTETPITASSVARWTESERRAATFLCAGCLVPVIPYNMDSIKMSPTFSVGSKGAAHEADCERKFPQDNPLSSRDSKTSLEGTRSGIPHRLVLVDRTVAAKKAPGEGDSDVDVDNRRRSRSGGGTARSVPGGRSRDAHTLGRVVDNWNYLAAKSAREAQLLRIPGVDADNYRYAFRRISVWNDEIPALAARVFYAELRWTAPLSEDGDLLTITLLPKQPRSRNPLLCTLTIDRTGWPTGRRNALQRELDWAYTHARESWRVDKSSALQVFVIAQQHPDDLTAFSVNDTRLIYLTDHKITH
ncbi:hypothetical protein [Rhodococcus qingshengii]|uniref:hypothetical protein n=1 Tax=Rhodococcus qingshengii TaxID=334542 RepID=UPI00237C7635|nr:hypothetical protein [Rhodococcus qingshengii]WCT05898.1 hypothetical protein PI247_29155 [Rhodococcus qingshengii]